jgi:subfamily B ATP-binding cassette protein MsbA
MTSGDLLAYIIFTGMMALPIIQIASIGTQITEAFAGLDRIHEILDTPREDADDANRAALGDLRGEIEFEDVTFEYDPGVPVLKNISFRAAAGTTTALVGSSGIGQEHVDQPGDGLQSADDGTPARRRTRCAVAAPR